MSENILGKHLKDLRKSHNYTQEYVASYLDVIRQSYSHYETGRIKPSLETLNKLAVLYQIPLEELLHVQLASNLMENDICLPSPGKSELRFSNKEIALIKNFRKLKQEDQQDILDFIEIKISRTALNSE